VVFLLPAEHRVLTWTVLGVSYLALCGYAAATLSSTILGRCVNRVESTDKVAVTFDDGPAPSGTPEVLDLLAERGVPANFFCVGKHAERHPELVKRIHAEGHLVGNHSFRHTPWLSLFGPGALGADLSRCQESIRAILGITPTLFRPPFGLRNHATDAAARRNDLRVVGWDTGGGDTMGRSADAIVARIEGSLRPGSIILLHDHSSDVQRTVEVTRRVLDAIAARGLTPARLDELIGG
jgi:peptidoglycan/xylan/chitin deacetylase (PgdA/CDA1 family)